MTHFQSSHVPVLSSYLTWYMHAGTANNAGAILVLGRDLVVVPKLIHPLPPAITSPETSPEHHIEDTWMQVMLVCSILGTGVSMVITLCPFLTPYFV